ncbi:aminodeoxychorismate/anthranilate synthase component II [Ureibacillus sp. FSL K6-8385]|uniref:Aminodeoxychorismate/anthranilate synthase component II n=1 Tax=Ureibacillus terrenus TaxID=118246 RepID=A0A540V6A9_9BACL|nr:aminodeoxychorismate/anthranilate synthase component II [Ureibacillus terrenus]MED3660727.1 aminodeoxychorismate/anthranilate synthase component II [Ureibacillus terrenus]MED3762913.1 aminodeoxychorismate/anthranilate synthase component II [Ureibacillus terrenus]TQE92286.1 aminodeoxychorismate/anthranilate synthase component II [Ureibacillus terrenus]
MILLIDHYDSFTYNLFQQIASLGKEVKVVRHDEITMDEIRLLKPEAIVLSPGPGRPEDTPQTVSLVKELYKEIPILGVCLGHQIIGAAFGGEIVQASRIMHGKTSLLNYERKGLFKEFSDDVEVMRYHSLVIEPTTLSEEFEIVATSKDDGEIMAIQHKQYPVYGVQFHPESIGTPEGTKLMEVFLGSV